MTVRTAGPQEAASPETAGCDQVKFAVQSPEPLLVELTERSDRQPDNVGEASTVRIKAPVDVQPVALSATYCTFTVPATVPVKLAVPSLLLTKVAMPEPPVTDQVWVIGGLLFKGLPLSVIVPLMQTLAEPVMLTAGVQEVVAAASVAQLPVLPLTVVVPATIN